MRIVFLGLDYPGHTNPCGILIKELEKAQHEVVYLKYRFKDSTPRDLASWMGEFQNKIDEQVALYAPLIEQEKFDLMISELPIFAAAELKELFGLPWAIFNALPLFTHIRPADLFLQASIPEFEQWKSYENVHYVGFFVEKSGTSVAKKKENKPIIHVTQGTMPNQDDYLIQITKQALANGHSNEYFLVSEAVPHKIWMPSFDVFITNGGFGGVSQAIYHGIPIICAGETEDKPIVAEKVEKAGIGVNLKTSKPSKIQIISAIQNCLSNWQIQENCKKLSKIAKGYNYQKAINLIENLSCKA